MNRTLIRHAQLFELLRQQNISDRVCTRSQNRPSNADMDYVQTLAARSWARPAR